MLIEEFRAQLEGNGWDDSAIDRLMADLVSEYPDFLDREVKAMSAGSNFLVVDDEFAASFLEGQPNPAARGYSSIIIRHKLTPAQTDALRQHVLKKAGYHGKNPKFTEALEKKLAKGEILSIPTGNGKLGDIHSMSLPVGQWRPGGGGSCIGASEQCESVCYLTKGYKEVTDTDVDGKVVTVRVPTDFYYAMGQQSYYMNWAVSEVFPALFVDLVTANVTSPIFRLHVGGDFYSPQYAAQWIAIAKNRPSTRFFAYTRSWQDGRGGIRSEMIPILHQFAIMPNCRLLLSCDEDTGVPPLTLVPGAVRAWMAVKDGAPSAPVELIFRDKSHVDSKIKSYLAFVRNAEKSRDAGRIEKAEEGEKKAADIREHFRRNLTHGSFAVAGKRVPVCPIESNFLYVKASGEKSCRTCAWCFSVLHSAAGTHREDEGQGMKMLTGVDVTRISQVMSKLFVPGAAANPADPALARLLEPMPSYGEEPMNANPEEEEVAGCHYCADNCECMEKDDEECECGKCETCPAGVDENSCTCCCDCEEESEGDEGPDPTPYVTEEGPEEREYAENPGGAPGISKLRMSDALITAWEGGSNYWVANAEYIPPPGMTVADLKAMAREAAFAETNDDMYNEVGLYASLPFLPPSVPWQIKFTVDGEDEPAFLTPKSMREAAGKLAASEIQNYRKIYGQLKDPDGDFDAGDADAWLQMAVFGEVIFG